MKASRKQEKDVAAKVGGSTIAGSGSGWAVKNDVRNMLWSFECKTTTKASYTLTAKALADAEKNALLDYRQMSFVIDMQGRRWYVVSEETFLSLLDAEE